MRERLPEAWGAWAARHWVRALLLGAAITVVAGIGIARVQLEMTFLSLMPRESEKVVQLRTFIEEFPAASMITVVVHDETSASRAAAQAQVVRAVDAIAAELSQPEYRPYVRRVQGSFDVEFFRDHAFLLADAEDLALVTTLIGFQYTMPSEISVALEYLFNGGGLSAEQRAAFGAGLDDYAAGASPAPLDYRGLFRPFAFARHYLFSSITIPWYQAATTHRVNSLVSLDGASVAMLPAITIEADGNLALELRWISLLS